LDQTISAIADTTWDDLSPEAQRKYDTLGGAIGAIASQFNRKVDVLKVGEALMAQFSDEESRRALGVVIETLTTFKRASKDRDLPKWLRTGFKQVLETGLDLRNSGSSRPRVAG
jgi:hypothetical protein